MLLSTHINYGNLFIQMNFQRKCIIWREIWGRKANMFKICIKIHLIYFIRNNLELGYFKAYDISYWNHYSDIVHSVDIILSCSLCRERPTQHFSTFEISSQRYFQSVSHIWSFKNLENQQLTTLKGGIFLKCNIY